MKNQKGFSLIELLIVVAIILIIAAIAIPSLLRARIAANESGAVGDTRTVISANETFHSSANGYAETLDCLAAPAGCELKAGTTPLLDTQMTDNTEPKSGYERTYIAGDVMTNGHLFNYAYAAEPAVDGRTGIRPFCGDNTGLVVHGDPGGTCCAGATVDTDACDPISK